jgi:hypothetical protein
MSSLVQLASMIPWFAWIPIFAILGGSAISITKIVTDHLERMERIRNGINPEERRF